MRCYLKIAFATIVQYSQYFRIFIYNLELNIWDIFIHRNIFFPQYFTNIRLICTTSPQYKYTYDQIKISCISKIKITCYDSCCLLSNFLSRTLAFLLLLILFFFYWFPSSWLGFQALQYIHSVMRLVQ